MQRLKTKLISDRLLRQRNDLSLGDNKGHINYYNTNFSLEVTSKVRKVGQKCTFTHKLTIDRSLIYLAELQNHKQQTVDAAFRNQSDGGVPVDMM